MGQYVMNCAVTFRPIREDDLEFLYQVYASTREDMKLVDWSPQQIEKFLRMQFRAQHEYYQQQYPDADYLIIVSGDQPIGRLYVDRRPDEIRIIDIAMLTEHRGGGIGGQIMLDLLDEAAAKGKPVRIHVLRDNIAMHLYDRLGFQKTGESGVYDLMEWTPPANRAETGRSERRDVPV